MRNVNIPYNIIRSECTYAQKAVLLWAWGVADNDKRYYLLSDRQYCHSRDMTLQAYANLWRMHRPEVSRMITIFKEYGIVKEDENGSAYIDFEYFLN